LAINPLEIIVTFLTVERNNLAPVQGVNIKVWDLTQTNVLGSTVTDNVGQGKVILSTPDNYIFTFEKDGYVTQTIQGIVILGPREQAFPTVYMDTVESVAVDLVLTDAEKRLVSILRKHLKDDRPDLYKLDAREYRWSDEELLTYIYTSLADVNITPVKTNFTLEQSIVNNLGSLVVMGGMVFALLGASVLESWNTFSYSEGGLSLNIARGSLFNSAVGQLMARYIEIKNRTKKVFRPAPGAILPAPMPFRIRTFAPAQYRIR